MWDPLGSNLCLLHWLLLLLLSRFSRVRLLATPWTAAYQAPPSMDFPGKSTGVGCHFLLQCKKVKSESEVTQSCPTPSDPMDCSLPGSSVHGFSRQEYWSGVPLPSPPALADGFFTTEPPGKIPCSFAFDSCVYHKALIGRLALWSRVWALDASPALYSVCELG